MVRHVTRDARSQPDHLVDSPWDRERWAGSDAPGAGAQAMRMYVQEHLGRYAAGNAARPTGPDDPLIPAVDRVLVSWAAMLRGYQLDSSQKIHALRMLRSVLPGFATLEVAGGFQIDTSINDSFT